MNQLNYCGQPRQVVRPMSHHERIPSLSTAELLSQKVQPFALYEPEPEPVTKQKYAYSESRKQNHYKRRKSDQDFAPHIETIKRMRREGRGFTEIAEAIGMKRQTVNGYYWRNQELFEC